MKSKIELMHVVEQDNRGIDLQQVITLKVIAEVLIDIRGALIDIGDKLEQITRR